MSVNQCYAGVSSFPKHRSSWLAVAVIVTWVQNGWCGLQWPVWRWDQPCRTFCLRCILRSSARRKFWWYWIDQWMAPQYRISFLYQVLIKFQDDYDNVQCRNVCVWNFVNAKCVFSFLESNVFKWFCPPTYLIPLFEGGSWIVTREFNWNPHRYCHEYTIIFREGAYLLE